MGMMPTMDTEPIPTEPTIEPEPPDATSLVTGPSQASGSAAAGRGRGTKVRRLAIGLALVLTFSIGIGVGRFGLPDVGGALATTPSPTDSATQFGLIREAWDVLHKDYVGASSLDDKALIYGAIDGMTQAVGDTGHTSFVTPEQRAARAKDLSGSYVGIGVRMSVAADSLPKIVGVFSGSPAEKAGLTAGEEIVKVDGKATDGQAMDAVAGWVLGEAGSTVVVSVRTGADGPVTDVPIVRADVTVSAVSWTLVPGTKTAMLRLDSFSHGSADQVKAALGEIIAAGADRVIFDLRGNPGGYVNEAEGVASQFLSSGTVYIERDAAGHETTHAVSPGGLGITIPLVVLVDAGTASSAEIVTGAIQDAGRAQIVGIKTYGTGTVLGEFPLSDGSALRVGTTEWLTPKGRQIWHQGITPDVVVERTTDVSALGPDDIRAMTPAQVGAIKDTQLARALELVTTVTAAGS
jgi:carboxyl-terminal processing protease